MDIQARIFDLLLAIPALVSGLTVHEFAHAWMADKRGDDTARREGRVTLDPVRHIDAFGAIFMIVAWISGFGVGWAKAVPVHPGRMKNPRIDSMWVALAGPISNVLQAPIWLAMLALYAFVAQRAGWIESTIQLWRVVPYGTNPASASASFALVFGRMLMWGVMLNIGLAAFNMIPIPPLDGHWVLQALGPPFIGEFFDMIRPYSFILLIVLLQIDLPGYGGLLDRAILPAYVLAIRAIAGVLGLGFDLY